MKNKKENNSEELSVHMPLDISKDFTYEMIVFSDLRWDFIYQRPQHIISRIAEKYKTLYVEEPLPVEDDEKVGFDIEVISKNLNVLKPRVSSISDIKQILQRLEIRKTEFTWFYSPLFLELLDFVTTDYIIYDCMNDWSLQDPLTNLFQKKQEDLMDIADMVLTGGISFFEKKSRYRNNVYCFPSSVDYDHFAKARHPLPIPKDIEYIKAPVIGYVGVIDERIDMELIQKTAEIMPEYNFVMIGPVRNIDASDKIEADNIHYLGVKDYKVLPNYLRAFDFAMMPFILNEHTKYINPTKTLEYMASGKPIIATRIKDIVRKYAHCVSLINSAEEFKKAVQELETASVKVRHAKYCSILNKTSWDYTVSGMMDLLKKRIAAS